MSQFPYVPCELCETPTRMTGTKRCDSCWELGRRIEAHPEIAAAILAKLTTLTLTDESSGGSGQ